MKMNRNTFSVVADIDVEESMFFKIQNFLQAISFFFFFSFVIKTNINDMGSFKEYVTLRG